MNHLLLSRRPGSGSALVPLLILVVLAAASAAAMALVQYREHRASQDAVAGSQAFSVAEGALDEAVAVYAARGADGLSAMRYPRTAAGATWTVTVTRGDADPALADDLVRFVSTATVHGVSTTIEAVHQEIARDEWRGFGVFGASGVTVNSNSWSDSYNSTSGRWASQPRQRLRSFSYVNDGGSVATNGSIRMDSNAAVFGDATPGPGGRVTMASNAVVTGSTTPAAAAMTIPEVSVPSIRPSGAWSVKGERSASIASGDHAFTSFSAGSNSRITITGPATIVVGSFSVDSNVNIALDTRAGPVSIYVTDSFRMDSNTVLVPSSGRPKDASILFSGVGARVSIGSNVTVVGTILAPHSTVWIDSNATIEGSVAADTVTVDSNVAVHFDESLLGDAAPAEAPSYPRVAWAARGHRR